MRVLVNLSADIARVFPGKLFEAEENDLYTLIAGLPKNAATRQLNDLIKRARLCRVHAHLMDHFRSEMPSFFGKASAQKEMIANLSSICQVGGTIMNHLRAPCMTKTRIYVIRQVIVIVAKRKSSQISGMG